MDLNNIKKHDQAIVRQHNIRLVLNVIREYRPISRIGISKITKISPTLAGKIVNYLIEKNLVFETELISETGNAGRRASMLDIKKDGIYSMGIEIQKKKISFGLIDFHENLTSIHSVAHCALECDPQETIKVISDVVAEMLNEKKINVCGIGLGVPGIVDFIDGVVVHSATLGWNNFDALNKLQEKTGITVSLDNDLKFKLLGEFYYGSVKKNNIALISIGTGVGSAFIHERKIFRGSNNIAGEIGHRTIDPNGNLCDCGKRGCFQTYVDESAILAEANRIRKIDEISELYTLALNNDELALNIMKRVAMYIADIINDTACFYNPETLILSGELVENYSPIVDMVRTCLKEFLWNQFTDNLIITTSELKECGVIRGGGAFALRNYLQNF